MAATCELSNILTNVMSTMYQTEESQHILCHGPLLGVQLPSEVLAHSSWYTVLPQLWTKNHVLEWISYHVEKTNYDASTLNMSFCSMDGSELSRLSRESFLSIFGPLGDHLYRSLRELSGFDDELNSLFNDISDILPIDDGSQSLLETVRFGTTSLRFQIPRSPDSGGSDSDIDCTDVKPTIMPESFVKTERSDCKPYKRGRGRPRKMSRGAVDCLEVKKSKHSPRGTHLWEFIRDILIYPELNNGLMKWEDRTEGVFKFLKSEAVAQLWGQKKKNSSMTYEKLSRAMRYYYKREILERVDGRRLVYKFGKNSSGWKLGEVAVHS
ncbi:ETS-related transcription factor Elf-3 isoform X2 [Erpetoichthys calabaricus]|uniref:ETS-related transcription factor Elf-3 isoform X2 n=1 Tax=Erpetoichthys calabaricus TaxID=27687 RepID=UPI0010A0AABA|nr:ETS-related transcription factor Elf-3 isoform X2 [Erpetoichthys calabaricus]